MNSSSLIASFPEPLRSDHLGDLDNPGPERRLALWVAGAFFVGLLGLLAVLPLASAVVGVGTLTVAGSRQAVQHRTGGIVSSLLVKEGQLVKKGQILLTLAATDINAQERGLSLEIYALMAQRERLKAERDELSSMSEPVEFSELTGRDLGLAREAFEGQKHLFLARRSATDAQLQILDRRKSQTVEQASGTLRQMKANREQLRLILAELDGMRKLANDGFASINRIRALERTAAQLEGEYGALEAAVAKAGDAGGEVAMQSIAVRRNVAREVSQELRDINLRIDENIPKLSALREQLDRSEIRSPSNGIVVGLNVFTVGGVIAPGQTIMEIVPQDKTLMVTARISPSFADDVRIGQIAQVRFPGIHDRMMLPLDGNVTAVSADELVDQHTGSSYFQVQVTIRPAGLDEAGKKLANSRLVAGMPVEMFVPIRERSALRYIFEPLLQTFWHVGREE